MELYAQAAQLFLAEDSTSEAKKCREKVGKRKQRVLIVMCSAADVPAEGSTSPNCWGNGGSWGTD